MHSLTIEFSSNHICEYSNDQTDECVRSLLSNALSTMSKLEKFDFRCVRQSFLFFCNPAELLIFSIRVEKLIVMITQDYIETSCENFRRDSRLADRLSILAG
jgi:hypothetical protein